MHKLEELELNNLSEESDNELRNGKGDDTEDQERAESQSEPLQDKSVFPCNVRIEIPNLNIRKGPGIDYCIMGMAVAGVHTIVSEHSGLGSVKGFGELDADKGWISLDHATKI